MSLGGGAAALPPGLHGVFCQYHTNGSVVWGPATSGCSSERDLGEGWSAFFLLKKSKDGVSSGKSQPQRGPGCADSGGFYLLVCMEFTRFSTPLDH